MPGARPPDFPPYPRCIDSSRSVTLLLLLNGSLAFCGWRLRTVTGRGAFAGFFVGGAVILGLGWPGYLVLLLYFALGALATRIGWSRKRALGIAEAPGRRPGPRGRCSRTGARRSSSVRSRGCSPAVGRRRPAARVRRFARHWRGRHGVVRGRQVLWRTGQGGFRTSPGRPPARRAASASGVRSPGCWPPSSVGAAATGGDLIPLAWLLPVSGAGFPRRPAGRSCFPPLEDRGVLDNNGVNAVSVSAGGLLAFGWGWIASGGGAG